MGGRSRSEGKTGVLRTGGAVLALIGATAGAAAALDVATPSARVYREGPPPGFSGGFGEQSCHACHFDAEVNDGVGTLSLDGVPERYLPGERYRLTVTLVRSGIRLGGFQLTSRFASNGTQAGVVTPSTEDADRIGTAGDRQVTYAYQMAEGAEPIAGDTARWTVFWTAPEGGDAVRFSVAANAADGDASADGDFIYTTEVEIAPD